MNSIILNEIPFLSDVIMIRQDFRGYSKALKYIFYKNNKKYFLKISDNNNVKDLKNIYKTYIESKIPTPKLIEVNYIEKENKTYAIYDYIEGLTLEELSKIDNISNLETIARKIGCYLSKLYKIKGNHKHFKIELEEEIIKLEENAVNLKEYYKEINSKSLPKIDLKRLFENFLSLKKYIILNDPVFIHSDINLFNIIIVNEEPVFVDIDGGIIKFRSLDFRGNCWWCWEGSKKEEQAIFKGIYKGIFNDKIPENFHKELAFTIIYEFLLRLYKYGKDLDQIEFSFLHFSMIFEKTNYFENYKFPWF